MTGEGDLRERAIASRKKKREFAAHVQQPPAEHLLESDADFAQVGVGIRGIRRGSVLHRLSCPGP